jgi:hypothetical protein
LSLIRLISFFFREGKSSIGDLPFPYDMISFIRKPGRVISILSASANNEILDNHESFIEYPHPIEMTANELLTVFDIRCTETNVQEFAGGHPYYVGLYLQIGEVAFLEKVHTDISQSAMKLQQTEPLKWPEVLGAIILCVLGCGRPYAFPYDKKFLVPERRSAKWIHFIPVFPSVLTVYRRLYWDDVMENVAQREALYLHVCKESETTNDTRGRLFEAIVIQRFKSRGLTIKGSWGGEQEYEVEVDSDLFECFSGSALPELAAVAEKTLYIPESCSFPAIDFFFRSGSKLVAVQVHISKHDPVCNTFMGMCRNAGWFTEHTKIVLIYLSPNMKTQAFSNRLVGPGETRRFSRTRGLDEGILYLGAKICADFQELADIVWPEDALSSSTSGAYV